MIREIFPEDNASLALIVRNAFTEFGAIRPGTAYYDFATDHLYETFQVPGSAYFVAEEGGVVLGGGGLFPTPGLPEDTVELCKMYLAPAARGRGLGGTLIRRCLAKAAELGYKRVYLETMPELRQAMALYERFGWKYLDGPMGNTGHFGCDRWMLLDLTSSPFPPHKSG
jgi:putative acetyltransferase